jgi:hypothetical protein
MRVVGSACVQLLQTTDEGRGGLSAKYNRRQRRGERLGATLPPRSRGIHQVATFGFRADDTRLKWRSRARCGIPSV